MPAERTVYDILNRLGYRLRRVRKTKPQKNFAETDAIFDNLRQVHAEAAQDPETLRISLDTKAKVKIGEFSRGGVARGQQSVRAADHDMHPDAVLAPAGILEVDSGQLNVVFGTSRDTSDFVADCLELWWTNRQAAHPGVRRLLIDLDNGPEIASSRTQFMKRLVEFSDRHQLTLELAYYPPYHSKYNLDRTLLGHSGKPLERHAAELRRDRSAMGQDDDVARRGSDRASAGPRLRDRRPPLTPRLFRPIAARLERSALLPKWSLVIHPEPG